MGLRRKLNLVLTTALLVTGATLGTAQVSEAKPAAISCAYGHVCGVDGHGQRFDFSACGRNEPIGLSGPGEYFNHQTPGTRALFLRSDGSIEWSIASGDDGYIDWTPIWWVRAC